MESENLPVLIDAKTEYTRQLTQILIPRLYEGFVSIYEEATQNCEDDKSLIMFQKFLSKIPEWTATMLTEEYERIQKKSNCDWLHDLIMGVFVSHTKVLASIKLKTDPLRDKPLKIKIPQGHLFIHECYKQCAREIWKNPYLFYHKVSQCDQQRNMRETYTVINDNIEETIRRLLPVKTILQEYLGEQYREDDNDIVSEIQVNQLSNVKNMVAKEINTTQIVDEDDTDDEYSTISIGEKAIRPSTELTVLSKKNPSLKDNTSPASEEAKSQHSKEDESPEIEISIVKSKATVPEEVSRIEPKVDLPEKDDDSGEEDENDEDDAGKVDETTHKDNDDQNKESEKEPEKESKDESTEKKHVSQDRDISENVDDAIEKTQNVPDEKGSEKDKSSENKSELSLIYSPALQEKTKNKITEIDFEKLLQVKEASQPASSISSRPNTEKSNRQIHYAFQES